MSRHGAGRDLARDLLGAMPSEEARRAATAILRRWAGATVYLPRDRGADREATAAALRALGVSFTDVVAAVAMRHRCSRRAARRAALRALATRPRFQEKRHAAGTDCAHRNKEPADDEQA